MATTVAGRRVGRRARVYYNSRRRCWSVKAGRAPVRHTRIVRLADVSWVVSDRGRLAALARGHGTVHAFAEGVLVATGPAALAGVTCPARVVYDYRRDETFVLADTLQPLRRSAGAPFTGAAFATRPEGD